MQTMLWAAMFYIVLIFGVIALTQAIRRRVRRNKDDKMKKGPTISRDRDKDE